ncbi:MAG: hypothetical protein A2Z20_00100 [Bdellovibrionales bacterium RBG_16_40_8]|nr:MAG: hypothetical protein A2Z20_00100 [Bdellovibrionales bacterium RBG_16_40_8]
MTQVEFGKVKEEVVEYCYNENKTKLLSKSCYQPKCKALNVIKKYKFTELFSQVGKPGFKLCRELKGTPQIIEFYVDKKPYKLDRCLFSDGSFVDTDHLLSQYLER